MDDPLILYGEAFASRLLCGTALFPSPALRAEAVRAAGAAIVTVALRRESGGSRAGEGFWSLIREMGLRVLPNTAGCRTVKEAVTTAEMGREVFGTSFVKLEVIGEDDTLQPDLFGLVEAAAILARDGFQVFPYTTEDLVAAARGLAGPDPRDRLADVEAYASGPYLVDLTRGLRDPAAVARMSEAVAGLTGLDRRFVQRLGGRVDASALTREKNRDAGRIASAYDSNVTGLDPEPFDGFSHHADPILDALKVPMATTMAELTAHRLNWPVQARYEILSTAVNAHWDWGGGHHQPEVMGDLAALLSLDPRFRAIVMHGVTDQVTPYYASKLLIDQLPSYGDPSRLRLAVYGGGHMPYLDDASRAAMHEDARRLVAGEGAVGQR